MNYESSKFFLDMILILGSNRMNIYIGLSILIIILNSEEREEVEEELNVVELVQKRGREIDVGKFCEVFQAVYEGVNIEKLKNEEIE